GARPDADDDDVLVGEIHIVAPTCRMELLTTKAVTSHEVWDARAVELPRCGDHDIEGFLGAIGEAHRPCTTAALLVEDERFDLGSQAKVVREAEIVTNSAQVVVDLALFRKSARPIEFRGERQRILM